MAEIESLTDAVAQLLGDGDSVGLEGFTDLIPFAAGLNSTVIGDHDAPRTRLGNPAQTW